MSSDVSELQQILEIPDYQPHFFMPRKACDYFSVSSGKICDVSVVQVCYQNSRKPWHFRVNKKSVSILFYSLNKNNHLVVVDSDANVYLYDCDRQVRIEHIQCYTGYSLHVQCNDQYLYLFTDGCNSEDEAIASYSYSLNLIDYNNFGLVSTKILDADYAPLQEPFNSKERFSYCLDGNSYYMERLDGRSINTRNMGVFRFDLEQEKSRGKMFDTSAFDPPSHFERQFTLISTAYGLGIRPHYMPFSKEILEEMYSGDYSYVDLPIPFAIEIFDLHSFSILDIVVVDSLYKHDIDKLEEGMFDILLCVNEPFDPRQAVSDDNMPSDEYTDAFDKFYRHIEWGAFHYSLPESYKENISTAAGCAIKLRSENIVDLDFSDMNNITISYIDGIMDADQIKHYVSDNFILSHDDSELSDTNVDDRLISNIIDIEQWDISCVKKALAQYLALLQDDVDALVVNEHVNVSVRIGHVNDESEPGVKLDDQTFFFKLDEFGQECVDDVVLLIQWFCRYKNSEALYHNEEATFLACAIEFLLRADIKYTHLYIEYISHVDMDHDVINGGICSELLSGDQWSHEKVALICALTYLDTQHWGNALIDRWPGALEVYVSTHYTIETFKPLMAGYAETYPEDLDEYIDSLTRLIGSDKLPVQVLKTFL